MWRLSVTISLVLSLSRTPGGGGVSLCVDATMHLGAYLAWSCLVIPEFVIGIFRD